MSSSAPPLAVDSDEVISFANEFVEADDVVGSKTRELKPYRRQRKQKYDALLKKAQEIDAEEFVITTRSGAKVRIVSKPRKLPITRDYLVRVLSEVLDSADKVEECVDAVIERRDVVRTFKIERDDQS
jgi:hypothetical protein